MCRTTINVTGDLAAAAVVSRGEAEAPAAAAVEALRQARPLRRPPSAGFFVPACPHPVWENGGPARLCPRRGPPSASDARRP
jgi:hypothetical protein